MIFREYIAPETAVLVLISMAPKAARKSPNADKILSSALPVHQAIDAGESHKAILTERLINLMARRRTTNRVIRSVKNARQIIHSVAVLIANTKEVLKMASSPGSGVYESAVLNEVSEKLVSMLPDLQDVMTELKRVYSRNTALEKDIEAAISSVNETQKNMLAVYCTFVDRETRDIVVADMTETHACSLPDPQPSYAGAGHVEDTEDKKASMPKFNCTRDLYPHPMAMGPPAPTPKSRAKSKVNRL